MNLFNNLKLLLEFFLEVLFALLKSIVGFYLHLFRLNLVLVHLLFLCQNSLLPRKFHLDLLALDVVESEDFIPLVHFSFPGGEFGVISLVVLEVTQAFLFFLLCLLKSKGLPLDGSCGQFHWRLDFVKVWHLSRLRPCEVQLSDDFLFHLDFGLLIFFNQIGPPLSRQFKFLSLTFIVCFSYRLSLGGSSFLFLPLNIGNAALEKILGNIGGLCLSW